MTVPFLHNQVPILREKVSKMAAVSGCSTLEYVTKNESVVLIHDSLESSTTSVNTELVMEPASLNGKRKSSSKSESSGGSSPKASRLQQSPPLLPKAKRSGRQHLVFPHSWNPSAGKLERCQEKEERSNEEEWRSVQVMLTCILGMVEKTQRAITILQHRQSSSGNLKITEEIFAAVQKEAKSAIAEMKLAALQEIKKSSVDAGSGDGEQVCQNCGRLATETCSGCSKASYCGAFCQARDWEVGGHRTVCGSTPELEVQTKEP